MNELNGIIKTKGNLKGTVNTNVKTRATVSVGGTLISSQTSKRGIPGTDGYSPSASVSKTGNKATITITDKDGTTTADIYDGSGGGASAFIAEYGVTPYADVKDAYDEDAIIICTVDDSGNTGIFQLAYFDDANDLYIFAQPESDGVHWTSIAIDDTWDDGYFSFAPNETVTQLRDGLMTALDKQKLDGIASGAEVNVQSDWNQSTSTADDYIKNKPTIPTDLSDLNNDMDVSDFPNDAGYITSAHEIPSGGTTGQVLTKDSGTDYDVSWTTVSGGGSVNDVTVDGTSIVDDGVAELETVTQLRDGLMTAIDKQKLDGIASGAEVNVQSNWSQSDSTADDFVKNKPTIPTKVSDLSNDSGFITTETDPTVPSWAKQSTKPSYTFSEIGSKPTTISGYGITDAKIASGTITLGSNSITPLTSFTETDPVFTASAAHGISSSDISNWNGKSDFSGSYNDLTDKPTIPTVNNATLTIQKNGTNVNTFTANASSNVTANITVHDVPSGGSANQVLAKNSNADYDLKWTSAGGGGGTLVQLVRW